MYHSKKQSGYKGIAISGVCCHIDEKETMGGYYVVTARVRTAEGKLFPCVMFNEMARDFIARGFQDKIVHIEGRLKNEGEIGVKFFDGEGGVARTSRVEVLTQEDKERYAKFLERSDLVIVEHTISDVKKSKGSSRKKDCVKVNGKWELCIEYALRVMGAKELMSALRDYKDDREPWGVRVDEPKKYRAKLASIVDICAGMNGDYVEMFNEQNKG